MLSSTRGARTLVRRRRESPSTKKFLGVALLGPPNSGKSMLLNRLAGEKVCSNLRGKT
jgi:tRNA U34 5-carboxymethylaminomethyl modifying GTPase MnmE/TrmE